jgi:hypothetical protein
VGLAFRLDGNDRDRGGDADLFQEEKMVVMLTEMENVATDGLRRAYRTAVILGIFMLVSLFFYAYIVESIAPGRSFLGAELAFVRYIFYGMAIAQLFVMKFIRNRILSKKEEGELPKLPLGKGHSTDIQKLLTATIVTYAFCEVPAIYGLVLFFLGKNKFDFYALSTLSIILFAVYFPRYPRWEEWMKTVS